MERGRGQCQANLIEPSRVEVEGREKARVDAAVQLLAAAAAAVDSSSNPL